MKMNYLFAFTTSLLLLTTISCQTEPDSQGDQNSDDKKEEKDQQGDKDHTLDSYKGQAGIEIPPGFKAEKVASDLGYARHIAIRDNGDIYVALRELENGKGTVALRDTTGNQEADVIKYFADYTGTGVAIKDGYLYRSSETAVYRYPLPQEGLKPDLTKKETILKGMPKQNSHAAKPIDFDQKGNMYVNVGAPSNSCMKENRTKGSPGMDPCPWLEEHGGIWRYKADETGQTHNPGNRYATGMRNVVALDWADAKGDLFIVQHGRDQLKSFFPELYTQEESAELPAEEFHRVKKGDNLGWPFCYYDQIEGKNVLSPEYGGDGDSVGRCSQYKEPLIGFPGHWGPNDLLFYEGNALPERYQGGAFIAFHGSWNRAPLPQGGYNVAYAPFENGQLTDTDEWHVFAKGFKGKEPLKSPRNAEHRPMGLGIGPNGALYITDSQGGSVWRLTSDG